MGFMYCFPGMIVRHALEAGIKVPENVDLDADDYPEDVYKNFPHWIVFSKVTLGYSYEEGQILHNATIISKVPDDKIMEITPKELIDLGCDFSQSRYLV